MISLRGRIYVATTPVDFRGSFDRLSGLVREQLRDDPRSGAFFVFVNRRGDRLKILYFDGTGDCIFYKRLDRRTFLGVIELDAEHARVEVDAAALQKLVAGAASPQNRRVH